MIKDLRADYPIRNLCQVLEVARSGYYYWNRGQASARELANAQLVQQIRTVYRANQGNYGSPRITKALGQSGQKYNHKRVERLMRLEGLKGATAKKKKVKTTDSEHEQPIAPNLLLNRPAPQKIDEVWVADLTYVRTAEGWLFLAAVMDLYSRQILGWSLWESMHAAGALQALSRALDKRVHPRGHSPFGSWAAVCVLGISAETAPLWLSSQHESQSQLLRQCGDGSFLEHAQARGPPAERPVAQRSGPARAL